MVSPSLAVTCVPPALDQPFASSTAGAGCAAGGAWMVPVVVRSTAGASAGAAPCGSSGAVSALTGSALATCAPATGAKAERPTVPD